MGDNENINDEKTLTNLEKVIQRNAKKSKDKQESEKKSIPIKDMETPANEVVVDVNAVLENNDKESTNKEESTNETSESVVDDVNQTENETNKEDNSLNNIVSKNSSNNKSNNPLDTIKQKYGISEYNVNKKNHQINVRVPKVMYDRFKEICDAMNASCNDTINKLLKDFIEQCSNEDYN